MRLIPLVTPKYDGCKHGNQTISNSAVMTAMPSVMESPADAELVEIDEGDELGVIAGWPCQREVF
jgi:hypothetical protein